MNHRPFEDWLLEETSLTPEQTRDLQAHLRTCSTCASLKDVNAVLHMTKQVAPAAGFSTRFQSRLIIRKAEQRRRNIVGLILLVVSGLAVIGWAASPLIAATVQSPSGVATSWLTSLIMFFSTLQMYSQIGKVFIEVLANVVPVFVWMIVGSGFAGLLLMWSFTFWKSTTLTTSVRSVS